MGATTPAYGSINLDQAAAVTGVLPLANGGTGFAAAGAAILPAWVKYTVSHTSLQAAALVNDIELFQLAAKQCLHAVMIKHSTAFSGGAIATYTLSVGLSGTLTKYTSAFDVFQATGNTVLQTSNSVNVENTAATTSVRLSAISTGANLNASAAGSVDVYVMLSTLP